ncbi:MAG: response regulator [Myxococcota bacterium]|nr:response regulator [Myxococcota bacterium]
MATQANILIVDDDADIGQYMKTLLETTGYRVTVVADPTLVLDTIKDETFHVLIVDLMMPRMDGIELIGHIRKQDSDVAIIVSTGYPSVDTAVDAMKLNVSDYVRKPFEVDQFRKTIEEVLKQKGILLNPEHELHKTIGQTIRRVRQQQSLTLKQLARRTGLSVSLLSQIERAESSASVSSLYKISAGLNIKTSSLFGDF